MTFTPTTLSSTISAANLNSNFDDAMSALNDLQDGGSGVVRHSLSFEFSTVTTSAQTVYFSTADDMDLVGVCITGYDTAGGATLTWTLAPTVVTAMLNQGTALTATTASLGAGTLLRDEATEYTDLHVLRKGVQYSLSVVSSTGSMDWVGVSLTLKYRPRRR